MQAQGSEEEQAALTTDLYAARKSAEDLQDESTAELEASIQSIEETNRKVRANLEKARAEDEAAKYASDYDKLCLLYTSRQPRVHR